SASEHPSRLPANEFPDRKNFRKTRSRPDPPECFPIHSSSESRFWTVSGKCRPAGTAHRFPEVRAHYRSHLLSPVRFCPHRNIPDQESYYSSNRTAAFFHLF